MTWIRAIPIEEADERLRELMERQRALYPVEYALQVSPSGDSVVTAHTLMPDALTSTESPTRWASGAGRKKTGIRTTDPF